MLFSRGGLRLARATEVSSVLRQARRWRQDMDTLSERRVSLEASICETVAARETLTPRLLAECMRAASWVDPEAEVWTKLIAVASEEVARLANKDFNAEDLLMLLAALRRSGQGAELRQRLLEMARARETEMNPVQTERLAGMLEGTGPKTTRSAEENGRMTGKIAAEKAVRVAKEYKREGGRETARVAEQVRELKRWLLETDEAKTASAEEFSAVARLVAAVKEDARPERQLFGAVCERLKTVEDVSVVGALVWTLGRLRSRDGISDEVVGHIVDVVLRNQTSIESKALSGILYAFGKMGVWSPRLAEGVKQRAVELVPTMKGCDLSSTIWGYAVSDEVCEELIVAVAEELQRRLASSSAVVEEELRLSPKDTFVCLWSLQTLLDEMPETLKPFYVAKTDSLVSGIANSSEAHRDLSRRLDMLGVKHVNELPVDTLAGPLVVDIGIPDRRVALEVDGPWHSVRLCGENSESAADGSVVPTGTSYRQDGPTAWKRRMLRRAGWRVLAITTKEYEMQRDKMYFLKLKLQEMLHA